MIPIKNVVKPKRQTRQLAESMKRGQKEKEKEKRKMEKERAGTDLPRLMAVGRATFIGLRGTTEG